MPKIPFSKPHITPQDVSSVTSCLRSSWISSKSPEVAKFERLFARRVSRTKYAVAVNSATSGLFLSLKALGIEKGDEVILPAFTMIATINAAILTGAKPVLVDSSAESWNLDVGELSKKITPRTKAVIPVHVYGFVCEMEKIKDVLKGKKIAVVEDAAEAMGSSYQGKRAGSFGDLAVFSLYANKIVTTGNGGMVTTNNNALAKAVKQLSFFDFDARTHHLHNSIGFNLTLTGLQASLGTSQLKRFSVYLAKRRNVFGWWQKYLGKSVLMVVPAPRGQNPNHWFPGVLFPNRRLKEKVVKKLAREGVETRNFFLPLNRQPVFKNLFKGQKFPMAENFFEKGLLLPSFFELTEQEIAWASNIIMKELG